MKLVLAEKPSVAQSIAKVLGATKREDGYLEGNGYVVSWCVGHLVELSQPEAYDEKYNKWAYNEHDILQNQFTSYLSFAVSNARIDFIRAKIARLKREQVTDQYELIFARDSFEIEAILENEILVQAIRDIREKERYVFLARVLEEKRFKEIAEELGMGEKGVAAIYYRTVKKLRDTLERGE